MPCVDGRAIANHKNVKNPVLLDILSRHNQPMISKTAILGILSLLVLSAGCTQAPPPPIAAPQAATPATQPLAVAPVAADSDFPTIPPGALYSLYCLTISTPTHIPDSEHLKQQLIHQTGSSNWYVLHGEGQSTLYYGFYKTFNDPAQPEEKSRAQADRLSVSQLRDSNGDMPFSGCGFVPLSSPDPDAPPEWDLRHAPGYWALQIAAYQGSPDRKRAAVDAVRAARAQGIEAYYYHGPSVSSVLIGTWPRQAVKEQDQTEARTDDPSKTIMVLPKPLPPGMATDNIVMPDGSRVKVMAPKLEIADPTLLAAMKQYPANVVNGQEIMHHVKTNQGEADLPDPSFLVVIPHDDQTNGDSNQNQDTPASGG
jgi:hypothetical protein